VIHSRWGIGMVLFTSIAQAFPYRVGISVTGGKHSGEVEERLEKRFERTLGNDRRSAIQFESIPLTRSALSDLDERLIQLKRFPSEILGGSATGPVDFAEVEKVIETLRQPLLYSPLIQKVRGAQAAVLFRQGKVKEAEHYLEKARRAHPQGALSSTVLESLRPEDRAQFEKWVGEGPSPLLGCSVDLSVEPRESLVSLNGFPLGAQKSFHVLSGTSYLARIEAPGYLPREVMVDCRRVGQWVEAVQLKRGTALQGETLSRLRLLSEFSQVDSILMAQFNGAGALDLLLYTPGFGVEPVPTESPITVASLNQESTDQRLPVGSDFLGGLVGKHRVAPFKAGLSQNEEAGYDLSMTRVATQNLPKEAAWYEKGTVWWVLGALGAALATGVVLSSGDRSQTHTTGIIGQME
jgi:hypothetical protein